MKGKKKIKRKFKVGDIITKKGENINYEIVGFDDFLQFKRYKIKQIVDLKDNSHWNYRQTLYYQPVKLTHEHGFFKNKEISENEARKKWQLCPKTYSKINQELYD